jgi:hypothetical protein
VSVHTLVIYFFYFSNINISIFLPFTTRPSKWSFILSLGATFPAHLVLCEFTILIIFAGKVKGKVVSVLN